MHTRIRIVSLWGPFKWCGCLLALACLTAGGLAHAQDDPAPSDGGIQAGQDSPNSNPDTAPNNDANAGPVRLARFGTIHGNVSWRADDSQPWAQATPNLPIRQGAQIWITEGGRAVVQFDDGSDLRLGNNALATLTTLYSDAQGEYTQITLNDGLSTIVTRNPHSVYQIDTPIASMKTVGPSRIRVGVDDGLEIAAQDGSATVEGRQGKVTLEHGDYLDLADTRSPYTVQAMPGGDSWDQWNDDQDRILEGNDTPSHRYLPANIALVAGDLDSYGTWRSDPAYGNVWCPSVTVADWRPYHYGHWAWVTPFGWTWVSDEPWGWAPYHYGTWVHAAYGWGWVPGPATQYWSPAVVSFSSYSGSIAWAPLCPAEVRYPAVSLGFRSAGLSLFFSIGGAAVYYPGGPNYCVARPFNTVYVNHVTYVNNVTNITNVYNNYSSRNTVINTRFVPINATRASGASIATTAAFTGHGTYTSLPRSQATAFTSGQTFGAPPAGRAPLAGPVSAPPTFRSISPTRTLAGQPSSSVQQRSIYHAPPPASLRGNLPADRSNISRTPTRPTNPTNLLPGRSSGSGSAADAAARARESLGLSGGGSRTGDGRSSNSDDRRSQGDSGQRGSGDVSGRSRTGSDTSQRGSGDGTGRSRSGSDTTGGQRRTSSSGYHVLERRSSDRSQSPQRGGSDDSKHGNSDHDKSNKP